MTVAGADHGSATAPPTSLTTSHATLDTVKTLARSDSPAEPSCMAPNGSV